MSEIATIAATIFKRAGQGRRFVVAIAGPPGSGKSTLPTALRDLLPAGSAVVVPMDGFHFDDTMLDRRGLRPRKGAPETFDFRRLRGAAEAHPRQRARHRHSGLRPHDRTVARRRRRSSARTSSSSSSRATTCCSTRRPGRARPLFDFTIFVDVPRDELERRLMERWHEHGKTDEAARAWIASNDMPNIDRVHHAPPAGRPGRQFGLSPEPNRAADVVVRLRQGRAPMCAPTNVCRSDAAEPEATRVKAAQQRRQLASQDRRRRRRSRRAIQGWQRSPSARRRPRR